ncbi:polysaccharide pyruvyl transferase family protein [Primorskyibacter aestuariivivens]|uniref:polysaccharide pyruvyl transferase family protein n=1 Tax=Primorskyibacter aestuariivivens TaxID=1888912 RepID=UPI0022FFE8BB|nr:polysaccharide pyruvyl transferase family protein [Primorskyibacter aestuariivivens]MDA7427267.1 polysaccharide pyruvyl transferase family protein [Primorskyibacter aestuariivivens]
MQRFGLSGDRGMRWGWSKTVNFGDWVGPYLYACRTGNAPVYCNTIRGGRAPVIFAAGSILHKISHPDQAVVWGTGIMSRDARFARPRDIRAVRGPLTRERCLELGYDCPEVYGDPAIILPDYIAPVPFVPGRVGLVPHLSHREEADRLFGHHDDVMIIDVGRSVEEVVLDIMSCEFLVSSSLHGVIIAHAYDRPCAPVAFSTALLGDGTKFDDYYLSAGNTCPRFERMRGSETCEQLSQMAQSTPIPHLEPLRQGLRQTCPF